MPNIAQLPKLLHAREHTSPSEHLPQLTSAMATATSAAASSFMGTRLPEVPSGLGQIQARLGFGKKKSPPKKTASKTASDRPLWYPGAKAPHYLDGSIVGDYGFDPLGLGKPVEYLQFDLDSLDQNLSKNVPGDIIGTRTESSEVKSTPFQPYSEVFGLQRFRECELIHGRWAMLATLGHGSQERSRGSERRPSFQFHCNVVERSRPFHTFYLKC